MGKLVVSEFVSVDGVMEAPGGEPDYAHTGWTTLFPFTPEYGAFKYQEVVDADALLLGRVTWESFAGAWPHYEGEMAVRMNDFPKYCVSTTATELDWNNSHLISEDVPAAIQRLTDEFDEILVAGSRTLVHTLYEHDLVDEYRLQVYPLILGSGRRLFPDDAPDKRILELVDVVQYGNGVSAQTWVPVR